MPHRRADSPYWWISYTDASGRRVRESSGTTDKKEAAALEAKRRHEAHQLQKWGTEPSRLIDELLLSYLRDTAHKKSHERDLYSAKPLYRHLSGRTVNSLSPQDINDYKRARKAEGVTGANGERIRDLSDGTLIKELRLLSAAINHARHEWGWDIPNVIAGRVPKKPAGRLRWLTPKEAEDLIEAARQGRGHRYLPHFIALGLNTGMRRDEMLGLEWSRVDLGQRLVYLQPDQAKGGSFQTVPLNDSAVAILRELWSRDDRHARWVFSLRGERIASVTNGFRLAVARAGLDDVTPHTLRHTCAAWLVQAGVPIRTVSQILRHTDIRATMIYAHLAPENVHQGVAALDLLQRDRIVTDTSKTEAEPAKLSQLVTMK